MSRSGASHSNSIHNRDGCNNSRPGSKRLGTNDSYEHLNEFIQDQIAKVKKHSRGAKSHTSSQRNNELIEAAARAKNSNDLLKIAQISGYQSNPMAATLEQRSMGLSKLKISKRAQDADSRLFKEQKPFCNDYENAVG